MPNLQATFHDWIHSENLLSLLAAEVGLMGKITSINLDDEAAAIAEHIPNLSSFVRESLIRWANQHRESAEAEHLHWRDPVGCCWPYSARGLCATCWPDGPPPFEAWTHFCKSPNKWDADHHGHDLEWIRLQAREHSEGAEINLRGLHMHRLGKVALTEKPKPGIFARLRAFLGR